MPKTGSLTRKRYKAKKPRNIRRRTYKPRAGPNAVVSRTSPLPDRYLTKLHYSQLITLAYAGALTRNQFRMNSIFDPDYSGVGHQPMGHDELAVLYNKYRVRGCKYHLMFSNTDQNYQAEVVVQHRPNTVLSGSFQDALESPYRQYKVLGAEGSGVRSISGYHDVAKVYGSKKSVINTDDSFWANVGANPNSTTYMNIYAQNQATAIALTILVRVQLTYYVEFFERKILGGS